MKSLTSLAIASAFAIPLSSSMPVKAGADYCHTTTRGNRVCIQSVFGTRSNRGIVFTVDGYVYSNRYNCYNYNYASTSVQAVACWNYTGLSSEPKSIPSANEMPDEVKNIMSGEGFIAEDQAIDLEKVKNAMPDEMK